MFLEEWCIMMHPHHKYTYGTGVVTSQSADLGDLGVPSWLSPHHDGSWLELWVSTGNGINLVEVPIPGSALVSTLPPRNLQNWRRKTPPEPTVSLQTFVLLKIWHFQNSNRIMMLTFHVCKQHLLILPISTTSLGCSPDPSGLNEEHLGLWEARRNWRIWRRRVRREAVDPPVKKALLLMVGFWLTSHGYVSKSWFRGNHIANLE